MADLHDSSPPTEALSAFQVALRLEFLRREIRDMRAELATAKANDDRFLEIERHYLAQQKTLGTMKKYVSAAVLAAMGALGTVVANKMAARISPEPLPAVTSSVASTTIDRVEAPHDAGRP
jgi:phage terminase Nu1 subunit (DNA packaging protein)